MEGCENELQMFGEAARSWQTLNMNFNSFCLSLTPTETENTACIKHFSDTG